MLDGFHDILVPLYRWIVYIWENPNLKWMMWGYPLWLWKLPYCRFFAPWIMEVAPQAGTEYAWNNYHEIAENTRLDVPRLLNMSFIDCIFLPSGRLPTGAQVSKQIPTAILWVCLSMNRVSHFLRWTHQFKNYPPVSIKRGNATSPIHKRMMVPMEPYPFPSHPATIDGG